MVKASIAKIKNASEAMKTYDVAALIKAQNDIVKSKDAYQELMIELDEYSKTIQSVGALIERELYPPSTEYETWDSKQSIRWICSLENGRYLKYRDTLRENMIRDGFKGSDFCDIDKADLRIYGVDVFSDRAALHKAIQKLLTVSPPEKTTIRCRVCRQISCILFGIFPLIIIVVCTILADGPRGRYSNADRELFRYISGIASAVFVGFITTICCCMCRMTD